MGKADHNIGAISMQRSIGADVSPSKISKNYGGFDPSRFEKRRPFAVDISLHDIVGGFVDGEPIFHFRAQIFDDLLHITSEESRAITAQPSAPHCEPGWIGKMMQRHHGFKHAFPQRADHLAVVGQRFHIPNTFQRFYTAPLDRKTVGIVSPGPCQVEILLEALVVATSFTRLVRQASRLLVFPPIIPAIVAFDLMA